MGIFWPRDHSKPCLVPNEVSHTHPEWYDGNNQNDIWLLLIKNSHRLWLPIDLSLMLWPFGGGRLILDHVVLIAEFPCFGSWSAHLSQGRCCCCCRRQVFPIFSTETFDMNISREAERSGRSWETGGQDETAVDGVFIVNALGEKQIISDVSKAIIHHPYGFMAYTCLYMFIPPIYGKPHSYKDNLFHGDPGYPFGFSSTFRRGSRTHFFHDSLVQKTGKHIIHIYIYLYSYEHMFFGSIILVGSLVLFHNSISNILFYNWFVCSTITFSCGSLQD